MLFNILKNVMYLINECQFTILSGSGYAKQDNQSPTIFNDLSPGADNTSAQEYVSETILDY